ncbi:hypothetical protein JW933_07330, partial [candidate division FCPU426 bacterium]|nr:hypothetical protein [candidate division FCPU426 bacterium]
MELPAFTDMLMAQAMGMLAPAACPVCGKSAGKHALAVLCSCCRPALKPRPVCQCCGHLLPETSWSRLISVHRCRSCRSFTPYFDCARAIGGYAGTWRKAVLHYKFAPGQHLTMQFLACACRILQAGGFQGGWQAVTSMPKRRGKDLSAMKILAKALAGKIRLPYYDVLRFAHDNLPQHTLGRRERVRNMRHCLETKGKHR